MVVTQFPKYFVGREFSVIAQSAVVGAAAHSSAATQTLSSAVIVMELTGQLNLILPLLMAVVIACGVSQVLGVGIYDSIMRYVLVIVVAGASIVVVTLGLRFVLQAEEHSTFADFAKDARGTQTGSQVGSIRAKTLITR